MSTYSEAYQEKFKRKDCPFILNCEIEVTHDFFTRMCKRDNYTGCQHFAKRFGELKVPMSWLQKHAIEQMRDPEQDIMTDIK